MTPKKIIKQLVIEIFDDIITDDLTKREKRIAARLVNLGVLKEVPWGDSAFKIVKINQEYFNEDQSTAVEEPEET